jgi:hypothetical protein
MMFERAFRDSENCLPMSKGIDVISMGGVALRRSLQVCAALQRPAAALRDNDGKTKAHWQSRFAADLEAGVRELFIGDPALGHTLEPQILDVNGDGTIRAILGYDGDKTTREWMSENKTEAALRIADSSETIAFPQYVLDAIEFCK